jgi:hypothetical protein
MGQQQNFGLSAPPLVQWLLNSELDVKNAVRAFIEGHGKAVITVAGPPREEDIPRYRANPYADVYLPTVTLCMRMVKHHLTGEPGVEVKTLNEAGLAELAMWRRQAMTRRARAA